MADPPVLVLDEATSSIDSRTEHLIEKGMDKLMNGRTTFVTVSYTHLDVYKRQALKRGALVVF